MLDNKIKCSSTGGWSWLSPTLANTSILLGPRYICCVKVVFVFSFRPLYLGMRMLNYIPRTFSSVWHTALYYFVSWLHHRNILQPCRAMWKPTWFFYFCFFKSVQAFFCCILELWMSVVSVTWTPIPGSPLLVLSCPSTMGASGCDSAGLIVSLGSEEPGYILMGKPGQRSVWCPAPFFLLAFLCHL